MLEYCVNRFFLAVILVYDLFIAMSSVNNACIVRNRHKVARYSKLSFIGSCLLWSRFIGRGRHYGEVFVRLPQSSRPRKLYVATLALMLHINNFNI